MPKKIRVGVLMGGPSAEREISFLTGKAIFDHLDKNKYDAAEIEMTRDSKFLLKKKFLDFANKDRKSFDVIFIALHGTPGEDGTIQGMFEALKIPYTGCRVLASALAMNKVTAGQFYFANGLLHPDFFDFKTDGWKKSRGEVLGKVKNNIGFPAVVKPVDQGSAVGVSIVKDESELAAAIDKTIKKFPWLMAQKFIKGKEATCGVLEKRGDLIAFPPTHILPNLGEFYDFKSKYAKGGSTHVCPADFSAKVNSEIQDLAKKAHTVLGCSGMSRSDFFVADDGQIYIIETNTIPGMTATSLFPEAAAKAGIAFPKLLDIIIESARRK